VNRIGTDAQQSEREQVYNALLDWLSTSSFTLEVKNQSSHYIVLIPVENTTAT